MEMKIIIKSCLNCVLIALFISFNVAEVHAKKIKEPACMLWLINVAAPHDGAFYSSEVKNSNWLAAKINTWTTYSDSRGNVSAFKLEDMITKDYMIDRLNGPRAYYGPDYDYNEVRDEIPWYYALATTRFTGKYLGRCKVGKGPHIKFLRNTGKYHQTSYPSSYVSDQIFLGLTSRYRYYTNTDLCGPNPVIQIYAQPFENGNRYSSSRGTKYTKKYQEASIEEMLYGFYASWDYKSRISKSHLEELEQHLKLVMLKSCSSLPSSIGLEILSLVPEASAGTVTQKGGRVKKVKYVFQLPVFKKIYSGEFRLNDVRQDLSVKPTVEDFIYRLRDHDETNRLSYGEKFFLAVQKAEKERAIKEAIARRRAQAARNANQQFGAFIEGIFQGITLHFADELICGVRSQQEANNSQCYQRYNKALDNYNAKFGVTYSLGTVLGMLVTPTQILYPEKMRETPEGLALIEAVEGGLSEFGEAGFYREVDKDRVVFNSGVSGGASYLLNQKKSK